MAESTPFQLYADLEPATEAALRASIIRFGVLVPVAKDQHGNILDGHQRARITADLGLAYPVNTIMVADEDEGREIARTLNEDRRAMPKEQRLPVVRALREEGHSLPAIAGALGVSHTQVARDLATCTDVQVPDRITGLDGKSRPARREAKAATTAPQKLPREQRVAQITALAAEGHTAAQIADRIGVCEQHVRNIVYDEGIALPDFVMRRHRRFDDGKVIRSTVDQLASLASGLAMLTGDDSVDAAEAADLLASLSTSLRALNRLSRRLLEMTR
jgi:site-specific DNA-methyltransferase (adenine-specific)